MSKKTDNTEQVGSSHTRIPFENSQGARLLIPKTLTLKDLVEMGVSQIRLMPEGSALPNGWWRNCDSPNEKDQAPVSAEAALDAELRRVRGEP